MRKTTDRRDFMQAALVLGCVTLGATPLPARAAPGRVLMGIALHAEDGPLMSAILREIRRTYQPDLGDKLVPMPGNGGSLAMAAARNSTPDGSTAWLAPSSLTTLGPLLRKLPGVDPVTDFIPVAAVAEFTSALVIGPAVPAQVTGAADFARWLQTNPMSLAFGTLGVGTPMHMVGAALGRAIDRPLRAAGYKSTVSLAEDLHGGSLPAAILPLPVALYAARKPGVRLLAVLSDTRWPGFPETPTLLELGLSTITAVESLGFYLPAATPPNKVRELGDAVRRAARSEAVLKLLGAATLRPIAANAADYAGVLANERAGWSAVLEQHRFTIDG